MFFGGSEVVTRSADSGLSDNNMRVATPANDET